MINAVIYKREGITVGYKVEGHAEYADRGEDVVCAAISVLTINTENSIDVLTEDSFTADMNGDGFVQLMMTEEISHDTSVLLSAFEIGVRAISEEYGNDYIKILIEEV